jgi:biopolymer transport protein ExbD
MALKSKNKVSATFNMSSMTDIVFLLLIFFMLTSTLVTHNELDLQLPQGSAITTEKSTTISVHIEDVESDTIKTPNFYIGSDKVEFNDLEGRIKDIKEDMEEFEGITLYTDKTVDVEHVANIMLIASKNEYKITLAVEEE